MDLQTLHDIFTGTYNPDQSIRHHAESSLTQISQQGGFISACLDLILNHQVETLVKLSAAINVKNLILLNWKNTPEDLNNSNKNQSSAANLKPLILISDEEKAVIKAKLMEIVIQITNISINHNNNVKYEEIHDLLNLKKNQLLPTLANIIALDYRATNDSLMLNGAIELIVNNGNDFAKIYTGLFVLMEIFRTFRWSSNKVRSESLDPILIKMFPVLVEISTPLVNEHQYLAKSLDDKLNVIIDDLHGELLKFITKCVKFIIYYDLPVPLQNKETAFTWVNLHLQIINKPLPPYVLSLVDKSDDDFSTVMEIKSNQWVKSKKWSFSNLSHLFTKYGTPMNSLVSSTNSSKEKNYLNFKIFFLEDFVPEILTLYFQLITSWCNKELYLSNDCLYHLVSFLDNCIKINKLWKRFFKNNLEDIISKFIYPILIVKNSTLRLIEEDPVEYIHINMDIFDEDSGVHDLAALNLITTLAEVRQNTSLKVILTICHDMLVNFNNMEETLDVAKRKEAILRMIGSISHILINPKNSYHSHLFDFLQYFVVPNLLNKFAFLRLRALEIISDFSTIDLSSNEEMLFKIYQGCLINLNVFNNETASVDINHFVTLDGQSLNGQLSDDDDSLLPVQTQAALTLQSFLRYPALKEILSKDIIVIMQKMLILSKKIDLDVISGIMQDIVEIFSQQLQPFGIELMKNLSQQIIGIFDEEEDLKAISPDRQTVINGVLNTMITILLSFENSSESIFQLEESFLFIVKAILDQHLDDFYTEVFELIENSTFLSRKISPSMWAIFTDSLLEKNFKAPKDDSLILTYLSEAAPALNNFLNYGYDDLINEPRYAMGYYEMLKIIIDNGYYPEGANKPEDDFDDSYSLENLYVFNELAANFILSLKIKSNVFATDLIELSITALLKRAFATLIEEYRESGKTDLVSQLKTAPLQYLGSIPAFEQVFASAFSSKKLKVNFLNLIISGLIYDTHTALNLLIKYNLFEFFFQTWFKSLVPDKTKKLKKADLKRVFDLKVSTLGLLSLLNNLSHEELAKYQLNLIVMQIMENLIFLIEKLPVAINALERKRTAFDEHSFDYDAEDQKLYEDQFHAFNGAEDDENEGDGGEDWLDEERKLIEGGDAKAPLVAGPILSSGDIKSGEFLNFLKTESKKLESELHASQLTSDCDNANNANTSNTGTEFNDDDYDDYYDEEDDDDDDDLFFDDEDVIEDPLSNNPLDNVNIFSVVKLSLNHWEGNDSETYQAFIGHLNETQLAMIQAILGLS